MENRQQQIPFGNDNQVSKRLMHHPLRYLRFGGREGATVESLSVQAAMLPRDERRSQFELLVRHLFDRLLNNEAFGEDAALRVTQLAYAIALPGLLVALFLFPAYHPLPPLPPVRPYWSQACDHLFYVTYAFVILGLAMVFQWELLFPDLLDAMVLTSLPISRAKLLLGRVAALGIFLGLVQVGTSGLGAGFLPAVADLRCGFWRHFAAQAIAVTMAGVFAAVSLMTLQAVMVCLPRGRFANRVSSGLKVLSVVVLLTVLFLFVPVSQSLARLVGGVRWWPPFWFLGVYECLLWGRGALPVFRGLAWTGIWATAGFAGAGALLYPVAYARRMRVLMESAAVAERGTAATGWRQRLVNGVLVRTPRERATFRFAAQTLGRLPRLGLYLAMYAGVGLALVLSGLVAFAVSGAGVRVVVTAGGVRAAVPVLAFWVVVGLRTALLTPLGRQGSWAFRVVLGQPEAEDLRGAEVLVRTAAVVLTLGLVGVLWGIGPAEMRGPRVAAGQVVMAVGLGVVLTDVFFLRVRTMPFTAVRPKTTIELPMIFVRYFVVFPEMVLLVVGAEGWVEATWLHLAVTALGFVAAHGLLVWLKGVLLARGEPMEEVLFAGLGLRED